MAEPAREIYDKEGTEQSEPTPSLRVIEGGGQTTPRKTDHLQSVHPSALDADQLQKAEGGGTDASSSQAEKQETADVDDATDQIGPGYREEGKGKKKRAQFRISRKQLLMGGGIGGGFAAVIISILMSLIPLKIVHIVENLQDRFFATSESVMDKYSDKLFSKYLREKVLPSMKARNCSTTLVTKSCVVSNGSGKLSRLYRAWSDGNLEGKLAKNYGIEFKYSNGDYYMKGPGLGKDLNIGGFASGLKDLNDFEQLDRAGIRSKMKEAFQEETFVKRVFYRYRVGKLLERKYHVKRCLIACKVRDLGSSFSDWKNNKKTAFKLLVVERVLEPRNSSIGVLLECIITGESCSKWTKNSDGHYEDEFEAKMASKLDELAEKFGRETVDELVQKAEKLLGELGDKGMMRVVIEVILKKVMEESAAEAASKAIPVIGWINTAANLITKINEGAKHLKRWAFLIGATGMVAQYMMYRTHADEIKTGKVDPELVGALTEQLGNNTKNGETAEDSPLYQDLLMSHPDDNTSVASLLFPSAFAAASTNEHYTCDDGKTIEAGAKICPEESLNTGGFIKLLYDLVHSPPFQALNAIAGAWNAVLGNVINWVANLPAAAAEPLTRRAMAPFESAIQPVTARLMKAIGDWLLPSPISADMSGARTFNMMAGGADVSGNDAAHYGLGGRQLTAQEATTVRQAYLQEQQQMFASKPLYARLFDKDSRYSLVSQVAMAMPLDSQIGLQSAASTLLNPFGKIASMIGNVFAFGPRVHAAVAEEDPFGVPQYGYTDADLANINPDDLTDAKCQQMNKAYNEYNRDHMDENTGTGSNNTVNPCLLNDAAIESAGGFFDASLIPSEDLGPISSDGGANGFTTDQTDVFADSSNIPCAPGTEDVGIADGYSGGKLIKIRRCAIPNLPSGGQDDNGVFGSYSGGKATVNARISGAVLAMVTAANKDGVNLAVNSAFRSMANQQSLCPCDGIRVARPGYSNHQMGLAMDIRTLPSTPGPVPGNPVWAWLAANAGKYGLRNYPAEAWHWSVNGH